MAKNILGIICLACWVIVLLSFSPLLADADPYGPWPAILSGCLVFGILSSIIVLILALIDHARRPRSKC